MLSGNSSPHLAPFFSHHLAGRRPFKHVNVGIVGRGIAGLYAALLLQSNGLRVHMFNGTDCVGGHVTLTTSRKKINTSKPAQFAFSLEIP
jgi:ribulose 1,5-bisphosphate synthetase/thiazole synthase